MSGPADGSRRIHRTLAGMMATAASIRLSREVVPTTPAMKNYGPGSDLRGIDGWSITCRVGGPAQLSEHLADAVRAAERDGARHGAVVLARRGRPVSESYVVMSLLDWLGVVAETVPAPPPEAAILPPAPSTGDTG